MALLPEVVFFAASTTSIASTLNTYPPEMVGSEP